MFVQQMLTQEHLEPILRELLEPLLPFKTTGPLYCDRPHQTHFPSHKPPTHTHFWHLCQIIIPVKQLDFSIFFLIKTAALIIAAGCRPTGCKH